MKTEIFVALIVATLIVIGLPTIYAQEGEGEGEGQIKGQAEGELEPIGPAFTEPAAVERAIRHYPGEVRRLFEARYTQAKLDRIQTKLLNIEKRTALEGAKRALKSAGLVVDEAALDAAVPLPIEVAE